MYLTIVIFGFCFQINYLLMAKNTKSTKLNSKVAVLESEIALLIEELN